MSQRPFGTSVTASIPPESSSQNRSFLTTSRESARDPDDGDRLVVRPPPRRTLLLFLTGRRAHQMARQRLDVRVLPRERRGEAAPERFAEGGHHLRRLQRGEPLAVEGGLRVDPLGRDAAVGGEARDEPGAHALLRAERARRSRRDTRALRRGRDVAHCSTPPHGAGSAHPRHPRRYARGGRGGSPPGGRRIRVPFTARFARA